MSAAPKINISEFVREELNKLPDNQRTLVLVWAEKATQIRDDKSLSYREKLRQLQEIETVPVVKVFFQRLALATKENFWDKRTWPGRLALGGLGIGIAAAGGQAAGIAALGGAIGIKLYILTSAGGALLGTIIEELKNSGGRK